MDAPNDSLAEIHANIGHCFMKLNDRSKARESFNKALACRPLATAHINFALLELEEGKVSEGVANSVSWPRSSNSVSSGAVTLKALEAAVSHCEAALVTKDGATNQTALTASRIIAAAKLAKPELFANRKWE